MRGAKWGDEDLSISEEDRRVICKQLGREPRGVLEVACRCVYGYPQVITNRPVVTGGDDVTVFPTLFWLTCPFLKRAVGRLESAGVIQEFRDRVQSDPNFAAALGSSHQDYATSRRELVPEEVQRLLARNYPKRFWVLAKSGVGGSRESDGVKCLHTHLADFLVRGQNGIGQQVFSMLKEIRQCSSGNCSLELS